eukprot:353350-Chlamydomonas_euryale.AAC.6
MSRGWSPPAPPPHTHTLCVRHWSSPPGCGIAAAHQGVESQQPSRAWNRSSPSGCGMAAAHMCSLHAK